jgi:hypothetical protein
MRLKDHWFIDDFVCGDLKFVLHVIQFVHGLYDATLDSPRAQAGLSASSIAAIRFL